jgi:hypothetical protein
MFRTHKSAFASHSSATIATDIEKQFGAEREMVGMETLHALLMRPYPGHNDEIPRQLGLLMDRLPSLPELLVARFFSSQGEAHTYLVLTTWNPEAGDPLAADHPIELGSTDLALQRSERMYRLSLPATTEAETEEWVLRYLWGYSRSGLDARCSVVLFVRNPAGPEAQIRQRWIAGLRALAAETPLGQIFLARSIPQTEGETAAPLFLCYLGCPSQEDIHTIRAHPYYEGIINWLSRFAQVRILEVAPLFPDYHSPA